MKKVLSFLVAVSFIVLLPGFLPGQVRLDYSTYLGGSSCLEEGHAIAVDSAGCAYLTGRTASANFPTLNSYQSSCYTDSQDAFIAKFSSDGTNLVYSTFLGGNIPVPGAYSAGDEGFSIVVEDSFAYVCGVTSSSDFPLENPYQSSHAPYVGSYHDLFLSKLSSSGSSLIYSTYLGGSDNDINRGGLAVTDGFAYVSGSTDSADFPTANAYQAGYAGGSGQDAFLSKFSTSGSALVYSTYLGGTEAELRLYGLAVENYCPYISGSTDSPDFPTANPYQASLNSYKDIFVAKFSSDGSTLLYSTYLGGSVGDDSRGIAVESGCAYLTGATVSSNFPTLNPYQSSKAGGSFDVFVSKLSSSGSVLLYSTYLGGSGSEQDVDGGISVAAGCAYITGNTDSSDFPVRYSCQPFNAGADDVFLSKLSSTGAALIYSTYLGGSGGDVGSGIAVEDEAAYITGKTTSDDFPTSNPYQAANASAGCSPLNDAFVSKLSFQPRNKIMTDFDGDGTSDIAVFRAPASLWAVRFVTRVYFGSTLDQTVPADYNGDGTTEIATYRASNGMWAIRGITRCYYGNIYYQPRPGDYDGDGTSDLGLFRDDSGLWAVRGITRAYFGQQDDSPVPGFYDSDTTMDIALFRPSSSLWAVRGMTRLYLGQLADTPVPGDYSGDSIFDAGIFRPSEGVWAIRNVTRAYFGSGSDSPRPADYTGAGRDDIAIYRFSSGLWAVKGITRIYFGQFTDNPVTR